MNDDELLNSGQMRYHDCNDKGGLEWVGRNICSNVVSMRWGHDSEDKGDLKLDREVLEIKVFSVGVQALLRLACRPHYVCEE